MASTKAGAIQTTIEQVLDSTLHELRRFSAEISTYAEELSKNLEFVEVDAKIKHNAETIFYLSGMISSRLAFTDLELNPMAVVGVQTVRSGIYKKFDKASHILFRRARDKGVQVKFAGNSRREKETLPAFELVPFVIIENAIKYSPQNQQIFVKFEENNGRPLYVTVESLGPIVFPSEIDAIFDRGIRGRQVQKLGITGDGLGLYLAKFLCDYHDVALTAKSDQHSTFSMSGVPYSQFTIRLEI